MKQFIMLCGFLLSTLLVQSSVQSQEQVGNENARTVTVQVDVQAKLRPNDADEWVLYVYASKPGERLPLANFKGKLSQLPSEIILHQSSVLHVVLEYVLYPIRCIWRVGRY